MALLEVKDLSVSFERRQGVVRALDRLSFEVEAGEILGIVGESGCAKSVTSLAVMGLLPPHARMSASVLQFEGRDLLTMGDDERRALRGSAMAMIFQDPMSSLNPSFTVGFQIEEVLTLHAGMSKTQARAESKKLLDQVGIPRAQERLGLYPHELSGGMCQRVMIAIAIACRPKLLIADEPTTALDVTIQAQILNLLRDLRSEVGMGLVLITHDLAVVSEMADRIMVMYAGQAVESGRTHEVLTRPTHPYTDGLLRCLPGLQKGRRLPTIGGTVPDLAHRPKGCQMHPRCGFAKHHCSQAEPILEQVASAHFARCFYPLSHATTESPQP